MKFHPPFSKAWRGLLLSLCVLIPSIAFSQTRGVLTLAGSVQLTGTNNGPLGSALFNDPTGMAIDAAGNIFVADNWNHVIRKITPAGVVSTFAGQAGVPGSKDAIGTNASFNNPSGIAFAANGLLYVTDTANDTIRCITTNGVVTTLAGFAGQNGATNAAGSLARFDTPLGIAVDSSGFIYVADSANHLIRKITPGGAVTTLAGLAGVWGGEDGIGTNALFNGPVGIALDAAGNLFVSDANNHTIRKITAAGVVSTWAGSPGVDGTMDGDGTNALFGKPAELKFDRFQNLFVIDSFYHTIRKITTNAAVTTVAGQAGSSGASNGVGEFARFFSPYGMAIDHNGSLVVSDTYNETIRLVYNPITASLTEMADGLGVTWSASEGDSYQMQFRDAAGMDWQNLGGSVTATNSQAEFIDLPPSSGVRFYRVKLLP